MKVRIYIYLYLIYHGVICSVHTCTEARRRSWMASSINSQPYSLESDSLTEPGAMLVASKAFSAPHCTGDTGGSSHAKIFMQEPVDLNSVSSCLHRNIFYLKSHLPRSKIWIQVKVQGFISCMYWTKVFTFWASVSMYEMEVNAQSLLLWV